MTRDHETGRRPNAFWGRGASTHPDGPTGEREEIKEMFVGFKTRCVGGEHVRLFSLVVTAFIICQHPALGQSESSVDTMQAASRRSTFVEPPEQDEEEPDPSPEPADRDKIGRDDDGKIKIDPELQKRIDDLLKQQDPKSHQVTPRTRTRAGDPRTARPGAREAERRPVPTRPVPRVRQPAPVLSDTEERPTPASPPDGGEATEPEGETTSLNIPPSQERVAPEERTYRFSIKDGTYEQLVEGFARQTGLGVMGDTPRDGKVTFVPTEELTFNEALSRVRMLLFNYKPHEPYWIFREEMNLKVIRVTDIRRILPRNRMFQSVEELQAAHLPPDDLALVIFTPKTGSVSGLKEVRDMMPDYVRVSPLEGQNRVTIFALKSDIDKYLELIEFFEGRGSDPRVLEKIFVKHLLPSEAIEKLQQLMELTTDGSSGRVQTRPRPGQRDAGATIDVLPEPEITIIPEDPQGYILVRAMPSTIDEIKEILPWIDVDIPLPQDTPVVIPVKHVDPEELVATLQQILAASDPTSAGGTAPVTKTPSRSRSRQAGPAASVTTSDLLLLAHPSLDAIIVLGGADSVERVRELVAMFDVAGRVGPERIPIEYADAEAVVAAITTVMNSPQKGKPAQASFVLSADPSGAAVWFSGTEKDHAKVIAMITALDVADAKPKLRVVDLKSALPSFVAGILQQYEGELAAVTPKMPRRRGPAKVGGAVKPELAVAKFTPDDEAKRLFLLCTDDEWTEFEPLIAQLDGLGEDAHPLYVRLELAHIDGETALQQLGPMLGDEAATVRWAAVDGAILVIGAAPDVLAQIRAFLPEIDKPSLVVQRTFDIHYADPAEIKTALETLVGAESSGRAASPVRQRVEGKPSITIPTVMEGLTIVQLGARLIVRAPADEMDRIAALIAEFDVETDETELRIYSDFPPGTDMASIAETLRTVLTGGRPISRRPRPAGSEGENDPRFIPQPASGKLVVIAQAADFGQIEELLNVLRTDVEIDKVEVAYIALRYAEPEEVIEGIEPLLAMQVRQWVATGELSEGLDAATGIAPKPGQHPTAQARRGVGQERYYLSSDPRNKRVVIAAPTKLIELAKGLIAEFDMPGGDTEAIFRTVALKNADATSMVKAIGDLMGGSGPRIPGAARKAAGAPQAVSTTLAQLAVTEAPGGGAIVLNGPKEDVEQAIDWIEHLDAMSTHGRTIKVFSIEYADLKRMVDLIMNVVDTPDTKMGGVRAVRVPSRRPPIEEEEDDFAPTKTYTGANIYIQADFVARTMLVATTEARMAEVEGIVAQFNVGPDPEHPDEVRGLVERPIPKFVYELAYRDPFDASSALEALLEQMWQPADEIPQVESALFGNALIIRYPDESRFDEIRRYIVDYVDKLTEEESKTIRKSIPVPAGISAEDLAILLKAKRAEYDINIQDITPEAYDFGVEVLKPYEKRQPHPCVPPHALSRAAEALGAQIMLLQDPPGEAQDPPSPPAEEPIVPSGQMDDLEEPVDFLEAQLMQVVDEPEARTEKRAENESPPEREKKRVPRGEKMNIYYDSNEGVIIVEGPTIIVDEADTWVEEIRDELKDLTVKPDIRMYRIVFIDVNTAKDILEEMFNATKQQRQMIQQQQRVAQQRLQQLQRQQQQAQRGQQGKDAQPQRPGQQQLQQQQQQPQVPQLPAESVRIYPNERDRALIIRADTSQFPIIEELLATIDRPKPIDSELKTFQLDRLNAVDVEQLLTEILGLDAATKTVGQRRSARRGAEAASMGPGAQLPQTIMQDITGGTGQLGVDPDDISISANEQTNTIVVVAPSAALEFISGIIDKLESEALPERIAKYYELKYASSEELAEYLDTHFAQAKGGSPTPRRGQGGASAASSYNTPSFTPYPRLNQLTVQATAEQIVEIDEIITRMDVPGEAMDWEDVPLTSSDAKTMADTLTKLYGESAPSGQRGRQQGTGGAVAAKFHGEEGGRVLFMTAPASLRDQILVTVKQIEASNETQKKLRYVDLEYATPSKVADAITKALEDESRGRRGATVARFSITAADGLKKMFVRADDDTFEEIQSLAKTLDTPGAIGFEFRVYTLQYADAKQVYTQLNKLMTDYIRRLGSAAQGMEAFSVEVDERANALVVLGSPAIFGFLEENLPKVDNPANAKSPPGFLMVAMKNADAQEVAGNINRLWSGKQLPAGELAPQAEANRSTNTLIVRGTQAQVDEIKREFIDPLEEQASVPTFIRIYPVKYADPNGVVNIINQWAKSRTPGSGKTLSAGDTVTAVAEQATQSVVVTASEENHAIILDLMTGLDNEELAVGQRKRDVIQLTYANAAEVANQLTQVFRNTGTRRRGDPGPAFVGDAKTNTVISYVSDEEMKEISDLLAKIDVEPTLGTERTTEVYALKYADPGSLNTVVLNLFRWDRGSQPSPSEQVTSAVEWATQSLIVTASPKNHEIVRTLVEKTDVESTMTQELRTYKLQKAVAEDVARALQGAYRGRRSTRRGEQPATITPEPATNALLVSANAQEHAELAKLIAELDVEPDLAQKQQVNVVQLDNADPQEVSRTLNEIFVRNAPRRGTQGPSISISAVQNAKALLVKCDSSDYEEIKSVIEQLDTEDAVIGGTTRVVTLKFGDATEIHKAMQESLTKPGGRSRELVGDVRLSALPQSNAILVTGSKDEVDRIEIQLREMDSATEEGVVPQVIVLQHAKVGQVLPALQELFTERRGGGRRNQEQPVITANEPNMLIIRSSQADFSAIQGVVAELDTPERADKPNYRIIQVAQGVNVNNLAETVERSVNEGAQAQAPSGGRGQKVPSITVTADTRTNALIVSGSPTLFDPAEELAKAMEGMGPSGGRTVRVVRPQKLSADEIQALINQLTGVEDSGGSRSSGRSSARRSSSSQSSGRRPQPSRPRGR